MIVNREQGYMNLLLREPSSHAIGLHKINIEIKSALHRLHHQQALLQQYMQFLFVISNEEAILK
jgi:hypothetical protein